MAQHVVAFKSILAFGDDPSRQQTARFFVPSGEVLAGRHGESGLLRSATAEFNSTHINTQSQRC